MARFFKKSKAQKLGDLLNSSVGLYVTDGQSSAAEDFLRCKRLIQLTAKKVNDQGGTNLAAEVMRDFDTRSTGYISPKQLKQFMHGLNVRPSPDELDALMQYLDPRKTKKIFYSNFLDLLDNSSFEASAAIEHKAREIRTLFQELVSSGQFADYKQVFNALDENEDGIIDHDEFQHCMAALRVRLAPGDITPLMNKFDITRDGVIDINEFVHFMESAPKPRRQLASKESLAFFLGDSKLDASVYNAARKLRYTFQTLKKQHYMAYKDIFAKMDADGSGFINKQEFQRALVEMNIDLTKVGQ